MLPTLYTTFSMKTFLDQPEWPLPPWHLSHYLESLPPPFWIYHNLHMHHDPGAHMIPGPFCLVSAPVQHPSLTPLASALWFGVCRPHPSAMPGPQSPTLPPVAQGSVFSYLSIPPLLLTPHTLLLQCVLLVSSNSPQPMKLPEKKKKKKISII